ncbi:MAG: GGDEF domain-containing protein [Cyanobacteria bacterium J06632_22]
MPELLLECVNLLAALAIFYGVLRLVPSLQLRLQRRTVRLLLAGTTLFAMNEALGVLGWLWPSEALQSLRDLLEMGMMGSIAIAVGLIVQSNRQEITQLSQAATIDRLTGLHNFGHFQTLAQQRTRRATAGQLPLSVILLDADNFKSYNDTFGHEAGNGVLQTIAATLRQAVRAGEEDIIARYGGEEFIVLLNSPLDQALGVADRICTQIAAQCQPTVTPTLQRAVTVSVGVATLAPQCSTLEQLIEAADQAMYQAKQAGKNQVRCSLRHVV